MSNSVTPWTAALQASLSITNSRSLLKLMSIQGGDAIQPSHPLSSLLLPPSIIPSIRVFSSASVLCIRWSKHQSFSFSISPSNDYSGLISHRMDWLDLLTVQLSHPCRTTGKTIALTTWTFVGKVMPLLFNMPLNFNKHIKVDLG